MHGWERKDTHMKYSKEEVMQYIEEENVKFIRLAFTDVFGKTKNISIMADELDRAFTHGISIDASAISGFGGDVHSDLLLHPDSSTITVLPWRPEHGRVVRMFCNITYPDQRPFEADSRSILCNAIEAAEKAGIQFAFGSEMEFYLFRCDDNGEPTKIPYDNAGYMDIAPDDKGENVRREICLTLEEMGIHPESSHHEEGPGQNEIDFRYSNPLTAAENAVTFRDVVRTIAFRNGLFADFSPKPLKNQAGNGMHINISAKSDSGNDVMPQIIAGILNYIPDITLFFNRTEDSYKRFGNNKAPRYISWSHENRSQLIRIPAAVGEYKRAELRSPDPLCNPYLAYALLIYAGLRGIRENLPLSPAMDLNLFTAPADVTRQIGLLPLSLEEAQVLAKNSAFVKEFVPDSVLSSYLA